MDDLVEHWRKLSCPPCGGSGIHPADSACLQNLHKIDPLDAADFFSRFDHSQNGEGRIIESLLPKPYVGSLRSCRILIVLANPGFHPGALEENRHQVLRSAVWRNLRQQIPQGEFPFFYLNPDFAWHSGFEWWTRVLDSVIKGVQMRSAAAKPSTMEVLRFLADHIACVESFPYPSKQSPGARALECPSSRLAKEAVDELVSREDRLVHVIRPRQWRSCWENSATLIVGGANLRNCLLNNDTVRRYLEFLPGPFA